MIRVLARCAALVDQLGGHPDGIDLRACAAAAGVPPSTAVRLLRDLVALGWADQQGPRGSYRLGPRVLALADASPWRAPLVAAGRAAVAALARSSGGEVILAVLRGHRRVVVLRSGTGRSALALEEQREVWASASGRLLAAHLPWRERRRLVAAIGLPARGAWPGVATAAELAAECAAIRRAGEVVNRPRSGAVDAIALAVPDGEGGTAALAVAVGKERWDEAGLRRQARAALRTLARRLPTG
ncbi:MAG: helix-turn-helix domain-containing protein [Planctomycetes bacterium]|nr:helix-turn-helix domain-containing protein [Planctomycetota bacterium]